MKEQNLRLRKLNDEVWKEVPATNGKYKVSNYGRVKSFAFNKKDGKIMTPSIMGHFNTIKVRVNQKVTNWYIHKLVAEVFIPKSDESLEHVIHIDMNYKNNHTSNLKWVTKEVLMEQQAKRNSMSFDRSIIRNSKLKKEDVAVLKALIQRGVTNVEIAKLFCISEMQVTRIKRGENWVHVKPKMID